MHRYIYAQTSPQIMATTLPIYPTILTVGNVTVLRFDGRSRYVTHRIPPAPQVAIVLRNGRAHAVATRTNVAWPRSIVVSATTITVNSEREAPSLWTPVKQKAQGKPATKGTTIPEKQTLQQRATHIATLADVLMALHNPTTYSYAITWLSTHKGIAKLLLDSPAPTTLLVEPPNIKRLAGWKEFLLERIGGEVRCNGGIIKVGAMNKARLQLTAQDGAFVVTGGIGKNRGHIFVFNEGWQATHSVVIETRHRVLAKQLWDPSRGRIDALNSRAAGPGPSTAIIATTWEGNVAAHSLSHLAGHGTGQESVPTLLYYAMTQDDQLFPPGVGFQTARADLIKLAAVDPATAKESLTRGWPLSIVLDAPQRLPYTAGRPFVPMAVVKKSTDSPYDNLDTLLDPNVTALFVRPKEDGWRVFAHVFDNKVHLFTKNKKRLSEGWERFAELIKPAFGSIAPCILDGELIAYSNNRTRADAVSPDTAQIRIFDCYVARGVDLSDQPYFERLNWLAELKVTPFITHDVPAVIRVNRDQARVALDVALQRCRAEKEEGIVIRKATSTLRALPKEHQNDIVVFKPAWDRLRWPLKAVLRFLGWDTRGKLAYFGARGVMYPTNHPWHGFVPVVATQYANIDAKTRERLIGAPEVPDRTEEKHNCYMTERGPLCTVTCERMLLYKVATSIKLWAPSAYYMQRVKVTGTMANRAATMAEFATLPSLICNPM